MVISRGSRTSGKIIPLTSCRHLLRPALVVSRHHGHMTLAASIVPLTAAHWPRVAAIYAAGIATGHATFESEPPSWEDFDATRLPHQRLVAVDPADRVLGWTAASAVSDR